MSIKRILAAAAASVVAVSAMAVSASAALATKTGNSDGTLIYEVDFSGLTEEQVASITKIEAKITITSDYVNGCIGYNDVASGWTSANQESSDAEATWVLEVAAGSLSALAEDGSLAPFVQIQFWWVNDTASGDAGVATLESVTLYNADGNAVTAGDADPDPADPEPAPADPEPAPADPEPAPTANNVDTGVEGVAAVLGVAAVAAGAMIVAKKRK